MPTPFLSSEEYDERAHALYNEGCYDEALELLREGLALYPAAVDLHVGIGYARLAREEYAWARRSFDESLVLDPDHEDALAGLGDVLLKFGQVDAASKVFGRTLLLDYDDDTELMLQIGRSYFREGHWERALEYFNYAVRSSPDSAEATACIGYVQHRMGNDDAAKLALERVLELDDELVEARIYLANLLYDAGDFLAALRTFEQTTPDQHWDDLGIWRLIELKKSAHNLGEGASQLQPWEARLVELDEDMDAIDSLLAEVEQQFSEREEAALTHAQGQLETLGNLLTGLVRQQRSEADDEGDGARLTAEERGVDPAQSDPDAWHKVVLQDGVQVEGTWEQIVRALRDSRDKKRTVDEFMAVEARKYYGATGARLPSHAPEAFIRASADAGLLRILN